MLRQSNFIAIIGFLSVMFVLTTNIAVASPLHSENASKTPIFFSIEKDTANEKMAVKAVNDMLTKAQTNVGRIINVATARIDLNGDGVKELFVRLLDQEAFCFDDVCKVIGFAITDKGLVKIAELNARTIDALETQHNGTKDLLVSYSPTQEGIIYSWQDGFYKKYEGQK